MNITLEGEMKTIGPRRRDKHSSYDESVDEPAKLIEAEPTDIEEENPADDNEPVEQSEANNEVEPAAFEE